MASNTLLPLLAVFIFCSSITAGKNGSAITPRVNKKISSALYLPSGSALIAACLEPELDLVKIQSLTEKGNVLRGFLPLNYEQFIEQIMPILADATKNQAGSKSKKRKPLFKKVHHRKSLEQIPASDNIDEPIAMSSYWSDSLIPIGSTALHIAVIRNEANLISVLLNTGIFEQVLALDEDKNTPLHLAMKEEDKAFFALMRGSLDPSETNQYRSFLMEALSRFNNRGHTVLHRAILVDEASKYVPELLNLGATPLLYTREAKSRNPVEIALGRNKIKTAVELVLAGGELPKIDHGAGLDLALLRQAIFADKENFVQWLQHQKKMPLDFLSNYRAGKIFTRNISAPVKPETPDLGILFRFDDTKKRLASRPTKSLPKGGHTLRFQEKTPQGKKQEDPCFE